VMTRSRVGIYPISTHRHFWDRGNRIPGEVFRKPGGNSLRRSQVRPHLLGCTHGYYGQCTGIHRYLRTSRGRLSGKSKQIADENPQLTGNR
jgi:hypothetical protein